MMSVFFFIFSILVLRSEAYFGYPYPQNQYPMNPYSQSPYQQIPYQSPYPFMPGNSPYMTPYNPYQGYGQGMSMYPLYIPSYGNVPTEIIDAPASQEEMSYEPAAQNVENAKETAETPDKNEKPGGVSPIFKPDMPPYRYAPVPAFKVVSSSSKNEVKELTTGPVETSSLTVSKPSQTIITRVIDPKTGEAKVGVTTNNDEANKKESAAKQPTVRSLNIKT